MAASGNTYRNYSDEALMELVGSKDAKAFEVLYDRYSRLMYNYFIRMLWKDKERARDFTQDLFMKLIHKPHLFDKNRQFKTWLYSIANNMCKNEYAKHEVRQTAHSEIRMQPQSDETLQAPGKIDRSTFAGKLEEELQKLDEVKRTTFELRFRQELSILEISEVMQCSEGTVKSRLFYTLKELNQKLKIFEGILLWIILWQFGNL